MPRFFIPELNDQFTTITGESAHHISRSLRMQPGEMITLCDTKGFDYHCKIESVGEEVVVSIVEKQPSQTAVSYTHLDVYKRQLVLRGMNIFLI